MGDGNTLRAIQILCLSSSRRIMRCTLIRDTVCAMSEAMFHAVGFHCDHLDYTCPSLVYSFAVPEKLTRESSYSPSIEPAACGGTSRPTNSGGWCEGTTPGWYGPCSVEPGSGAVHGLGWRGSA